MANHVRCLRVECSMYQVVEHSMHEGEGKCESVSLGVRTHEQDAGVQAYACMRVRAALLHLTKAIWLLAEVISSFKSFPALLSDVLAHLRSPTRPSPTHAHAQAHAHARTRTRTRTCTRTHMHTHTHAHERETSCEPV